MPHHSDEQEAELNTPPAAHEQDPPGLRPVRWRGGPVGSICTSCACNGGTAYAHHCGTAPCLSTLRPDGADIYYEIIPV